MSSFSDCPDLTFRVYPELDHLYCVNINSGMCVLFFTLYSILRKHPSNSEVYIPRVLAEGDYKKSSHFNLERLISSPDWLRRASKLTENDLLATSSLDAMVLLQLINFSLRVVLFARFIGVFMLLQVNCSGDALEYVD